LALFQNEWVNQFLAPKTPDDNFASLTKIIINHEPKRTIFQSLRDQRSLVYQIHRHD
jgi:hypothetical protein